ncbi:MAG: amidohydrolase family protein [Acidobacteriota bacterium]
MSNRFRESLRTSWRIGRFKSVEVRLHISMLLIVPFLVFPYPENRWDWMFCLIGMTGLLIGILLHEIGHTLVARHFGIAVKQVVIWPLGGVSQMSRAPEKPGQRLLISAAGPVASLSCALVLGAIWLTYASPTSLWIYLDPVWAQQIYNSLMFLAFLNGALALINLLPVHPLDGGEMFNALLGLFVSKGVANTISIVVGIPFFFGLIVFGIVTSDHVSKSVLFMAALEIGTFNPQSYRWIFLGINHLFGRPGYRHVSQDSDEAVRGHTVAPETNPEDGSRSMPLATRGPRFVFASFGVLSLVLLLTFGVLMTRRSAEAPVLVMEHASLIDGISDTPQRDVTVVVAEGTIKIVSAASISVPANAKRFDLSGLWLLPGFIDAHIHPAFISEILRNLAHSGMTTGRSVGTYHYLDVALRERHRRGQFDIPDILAAGYPVVPNIGAFPTGFPMEGIYGDHPQLKDLRPGADIGVAGAQRLVRANLDRHVDLIKVYAESRAFFSQGDPRGRALSKEQLAAAVAEARNAGVPVAAHAYGDEGAAAAVRAGVSSIEHGVYLTDATLELMKQANVFFVPTISSIYPAQGLTESDASNANTLTARRRDGAAGVRDSARRARNMGLRVIAGTDNTRSIGDEIVELVGIGMTPMEAIQAATSRCAEALGISQRTGSIRPGLEADLVVLDGNPLEDIKAVRHVVLGVKYGRIAANRLPPR